eukprot:1175736-Rhodomonas_salina.2
MPVHVLDNLHELGWAQVHPTCPPNSCSVLSVCILASDCENINHLDEEENESLAVCKWKQCGKPGH